VKKIIFFIKKCILSFFILYGFNVIAGSFNILIPINIFTVLITSILGFPALFSLILLYIFVY